jgi:nucleoside-diphosphate-sugar epimerase
MRVFVAGVAGVIGQHLVPMLTAAGHEVTGTTRSPGKADLIRRLGGTPVIMDGLDADGVRTAVSQSRPEVIIHQMTTADDTVIATQVYQLYINATQDEVWKAITDPAIVARFFHGAQRDATFEVGGRIRLYDPEMAAEPESRVTWEVEAQPGGYR